MFFRPQKINVQESNFASFYREFKKNRLAYFSFWVIVFLIILALFADFAAYNKPYYAVYRGQTYFPLFADYLSALGLYHWPADLINQSWRELPLDSAFWPPVTYLPHEQDRLNMQSVSPFATQNVAQARFWHYLGSDENGRDLLSGLIHGTRISLSIGLVSVTLSAFIGIFLGAIAGYFGDNRLKISRGAFLFLLAGVFIGFFYGFYRQSYALSDALGQGLGAFAWRFLFSFFIFAACLVVFYGLSLPFQKIGWFQKKVSIGIDLSVSRLIEVMVSIPILLLIVSIAAIASPSLFLVMAIIGLTSWTRIAALTRAEFLRIRNLEYIQAAQAQGFSEFRIMFRHALPNALAPVFVAVAFGVASAILVESSLTFLGLGAPPSTVTWGSLLSSARRAHGAWWLAVFPGFAIFITVTCFNLLGEGLRDALDPRLRK